jgi:WD40 repeat protein
MADIETGRLSASLSSVAPADVVMSPDGSRLYVAGEDGKLRVCDVASRALLSTWDVGVRLGGLDVSADGSFLLVVEKQIVASEPPGGNHDTRTTITAYRVDTASGQVTSFPTTIERNGPTGAFHDVAILADGTVLLSHEPAFYPLSILNLANGTYSHSGPWYAERGVLVTSRDKGEALFAPTNISDAPLHIYRAGQGITDSSATNGYPYGVVAFSEEANLVVQHLYSVQPTTGRVFTNLHVYNASLEYQFDLVSLHPEWADGRIAGLAFDASGANLFVLDEETNRIVQLRTADWTTVRTFDVGADVTGTADGDYGNRLLVSPDGRYFTVVTGSDLRIVENDALANVFAGTAGVDSLDGGAGDDHLSGLDGDDSLGGGSGNDFLDGGSGNDVLDGGSGADEMRGGAGDDVHIVDDAGDVVIENAGDGTDEVRTGLAIYVLAASVENLTATSDVNHDFRGNSGNNVITGGAGRDNLRLQDGGDDRVVGGAGNDNVFMIGSLTAADVVNGGDGNDTLILQGDYAGGITLTANVTEIEGISLLGGNNANFGEPGTNRYDYRITTMIRTSRPAFRRGSTARRCSPARISPSMARRRRTPSSWSTAAGAGTP